MTQTLLLGAGKILHFCAVSLSPDPFSIHAHQRSLQPILEVCVMSCPPPYCSQRVILSKDGLEIDSRILGCSSLRTTHHEMNGLLNNLYSGCISGVQLLAGFKHPCVRPACLPAQFRATVMSQDNRFLQPGLPGIAACVSVTIVALSIADRQLPRTMC